MHGEERGIHYSFEGAEKTEILEIPDDDQHGSVMIDIVLDSGFLGLADQKKFLKILSDDLFGY